MKSECDTEHLRDYPDCYEECEHDKCIGEPKFNNALEADAHNWDTREIEPKPSGRLLTDKELPKAFSAPLAIRYGYADGEALRHCTRIVKEERAKTASIKDAEWKQRLEQVDTEWQQEVDELNKTHQARIDALKQDIDKILRRPLMYFKANKLADTYHQSPINTTSHFVDEEAVNALWEALEATHTSKGEEG